MRTFSAEAIAGSGSRLEIGRLNDFIVEASTQPLAPARTQPQVRPEIGNKTQLPVVLTRCLDMKIPECSAPSSYWLGRQVMFRFFGSFSFKSKAAAFSPSFVPFGLRVGYENLYIPLGLTKG